MHKHRELLSLIKHSSNVDSPLSAPVSATPCHINRGQSSSYSCFVTTKSTFLNSNLLAGVREYLLLTLAFSSEALFIFLSSSNKLVYKSLLSLDKCCKSLYFHTRKQLRILINNCILTVGIIPSKRESFLVFSPLSSILRESYLPSKKAPLY